MTLISDVLNSFIRKQFTVKSRDCRDLLSRAQTSIKAATQFSEPRGMQGWVDRVGWLRTGRYTCPNMVTHPSTNRARRRITDMDQVFTGRTPSCHQINSVKTPKETQSNDVFQEKSPIGLSSSTTKLPDAPLFKPELTHLYSNMVVQCNQQQQPLLPFQIIMKQEVRGWQWYQLDLVKTICTTFQTDNHASTSPLNFCRLDALPDVNQQCQGTEGIMIGDMSP